jgi:transketolase
MRNAFAEEITRLAAHDPRIILLSGDIGNKLFDKFKQDNPSRFINCGVAESNMMSVAAGMAMSGLRPVVYTITPFTTTRCFEQIRVGVCYHNAPVVIVGTGAGLSYATLGPTHHSLEDFALLRSLPGMNVLAPCDTVELCLALQASLQQSGPVYMRIGKKGEPRIHDATPKFRIGKAITIRGGQDICFISAGNMMPVVVAAAEALDASGVSARVESFHTVKPLDTERLKEVFSQFPVVAIVEEHSKIGGLGGSIAEWLAREASPLGRMICFGTDDAFIHDLGSQDYVRQQFGLTQENIVAQVSNAIGAIRCPHAVTA